MGSQWLAMMGTGHQGKSMWTLGILLLGLASAQQTLSNEVGVEAGGYAVDPNDPSGYYSGQYASSGPGTDFYSQYPSDGVQSVQTASDTDRITPEIFNDALTVPIMLVAFGSAVLGSLLAPLLRLVMDVTSRISADLPAFDFPAFPLPRIRRRRKDDKYQKDRTLDSSSFIDSAIDNIVESIEDSEYDY